MKDIVKEKQLNEVLYGLDYIGNKARNEDAVLELGKNNCKLLLEEIERLTELCNKYEEEHKTTFETWQKDIKENELLHSIIKGAREYIHNRLDNEQDMYITQMAELLEILKCSDKVENDIEFDVLKALNTDLDDDVEMG